MSTDLLTCKQIHQHVSILVREAGGQLIGGSGGRSPPQDKMTGSICSSRSTFRNPFESFRLSLRIAICLTVPGKSFSHCFTRFHCVNIFRITFCRFSAVAPRSSAMEVPWHCRGSTMGNILQSLCSTPAVPWQRRGSTMPLP